MPARSAPLAPDLIVSTAPPERAGTASAIAETSGELGGAPGIALLGSVGAAAAGQLPGSALTVARDAYVTGLQVAALTGAPLMAATAAAATLALRRRTARTSNK